MSRRATLACCLPLWLASVAACTTGQLLDPEATSIVARTTCGWDEHSAGDPILAVDEFGEVSVDSYRHFVVVRAHSNTTFASVASALRDLNGVVRVKVPIADGGLLSLTPPMPRSIRIPINDPVESIVGHKRIKRERGAPTQRAAEVRFDGDMLQIFVEHSPVPIRTDLSRFNQALSDIEPKVEVFMFGATSATSWKQLASGLEVAACHDRLPRQEPHEVLLDLSVNKPRG